MSDTATRIEVGSIFCRKDVNDYTLAWKVVAVEADHSDGVTIESLRPIGGTLTLTTDELQAGFVRIRVPQQYANAELVPGQTVSETIGRVAQDMRTRGDLAPLGDEARQAGAIVMFLARAANLADWGRTEKTWRI